MAELFTPGELASYAQRDIDDATADLLLSLVTTEIRRHVGATVYDAMSDLDRADFKGIALEATRRAYLNPDGVRQESSAIDDYQESKTYAMETFGGVELTDSELARIDSILGRAGGAFTIRAKAEPFRPPYRHRIWAEDCITHVI